jgi:hypothetical protein
MSGNTGSRQTVVLAREIVERAVGHFDQLLANEGRAHSASWCDLRFAICDLRFAICDLRFAICECEGGRSRVLGLNPQHAVGFGGHSVSTSVVTRPWNSAGLGQDAAMT